MNTVTHRQASARPPRLPGLLLTAAIAALALWLGTVPWLQAHGISALTLAIVIGIAVGNTAYPALAPRVAAGVGISKATCAPPSPWRGGWAPACSGWSATPRC